MSKRINAAPKWISSKSKTELENGKGLITVTKALKIKGVNDAFVDVLFDNDVKIVGAYVRGSKQIDPSTNIIEEGSSRDTIYDECENKPTNFGVALCVADRTAEEIISWF